MEPVDRLLTQEEIDNVFQRLQQSASADDAARRAAVYDFRRPDRIPKDQLRAIHLLHDNFARNLSSSLSAYLRAYVMVNLVAVEQLSFSEFCRFLPTPTYLVSLGMKPFEGNAALEMNPSLLFPVLEMLLGGTGKGSSGIKRKITDIEQKLLDSLYRILLDNLRQAWQPVAAIDFSMEACETEPQLLQVMAPNEAVVAITMEMRIADSAGMLNLGIPSLIIKMLRQKFDQQWSARRAAQNEGQRDKVLNSIQGAKVTTEARLQGPQLLVRDLLALRPGDVLAFEHPVGGPVDLLVNGRWKFTGQITAERHKRAFVLGGAARAID